MPRKALILLDFLVTPNGYTKVTPIVLGVTPVRFSDSSVHRFGQAPDAVLALIIFLAEEAVLIPGIISIVVRVQVVAKPVEGVLFPFVEPAGSTASACAHS